MKRREAIAGSSAISGASYDEDTQELEIHFTSGHSYTFHDVPESVFQGLLAADSAGGFYNTQIKGVYT